MLRKITTLLLLAAMIVSILMPAASAAECTSNDILGKLETKLDAKVLDELLNNDQFDSIELDETVLNQLMANYTDQEMINALIANCDLSADLDASQLSPEAIKNMLQSKAVPTNSTCNTTEVPPSEPKAEKVETAKADEMSLTTPTVETEADAQPIPTKAVDNATPIPTEDVEVEVTPVATSTPKVQSTPETTVAPTAAPTVEPTPVPTAKPAATEEPATVPSGISAVEKKMVDMVNADRAAAGLAPLKIDMELTTYARAHSKDMSDNNFFSHTSPTNGGFSERLRNSNISVRGGGENIALYGSVEKAQAGLMASDGHRANILGNYTHVGIGIVWNEAKGAYYITQWFGRK